MSHNNHNSADPLSRSQHPSNSFQSSLFRSVGRIKHSDQWTVPWEYYMEERDNTDVCKVYCLFIIHAYIFTFIKGDDA